MPKSSAPAKVTSRYHSVSLARMESARMSIDNKCISSAVNSANQWPALRSVLQLISQAVDIYVERILLDLRRSSPARLDKLLSRSHQPAAAHEHFEEFHLLPRKRR